jgi:hypothetical protein
MRTLRTAIHWTAQSGATSGNGRIALAWRLLRNAAGPRLTTPAVPARKTVAEAVGSQTFGKPLRADEVPPPVDMGARIRERRAEAERRAGLSHFERLREDVARGLAAIRR